MLKIALALGVMLGLVGGITVWFGYRLVDPLGLTGWARWLGWALAVGPLLAFPLLMVAEQTRLIPGLHHLHGPVFVGLGLWSYLFVLLLLREVLWPVVGLSGLLPDEAARDVGLRWSSLGVMGLAVLLTAVGMVQALRPPALVKVQIPIEGLHPDLQGLRIAQITDVHLGAFTRQSILHGVVQRINAEQPHLVAVTGDLGEGHPDVLGHYADPLREIEAPTYFCPGNHEEIWDEEGWVGVVRERGVTVLREEHVVQEVGEGRLLVGGVSDYTGMRATAGHRSSPTQAREGAPAHDLALLLAHQPGSAWEAAEAGWDVQLSGHTHGGQYIPFAWMISLFQPFAVGLHQHEGLWIYTSVGTRFWGPPIRLGTRAEITLVELVAA